LLCACSFRGLDKLERGRAHDAGDAGGPMHEPVEAGALDAAVLDAQTMLADAASDADIAPVEQTGSDEPVDGPLVARWRLQNAAARVAVDTSRTGADGTFVGGATPSAEGLVLDGVDGTVHVDSSALDFDGALTVALWVRTTHTSISLSDTREQWWAGEWLVDKDTGPDQGWAITNHHGKAKFNVQTDAETLVSTTPINDGTWHHIAGVRNVFGARWLYIDGVLEDSASSGSTTALSNAEDLYLGSDTGMKGYAQATLKDVQIYNAALSADDVAALMGDEPLKAP
jgi:hypothetical protein